VSVIAGVGAGLLLTLGLLSVGVGHSGALAGGLIVALVATWALPDRRLGPGRPRTGRWLVLAFFASAAGLVAALLVLDGQSGPCTVDDLTGCSSLGEAAVFAELLLVPATAVLALLSGIVFLSRVFKSGD
jgi:hypothetical protein